MKRWLQFLNVLLVAIVMGAFSATLMQGKPEYTKKEGKSCTVCHTKTGSKELNDVGKCYEKGKPLKECEAKPK